MKSWLASPGSGEPEPGRSRAQQQQWQPALFFLNFVVHLCYNDNKGLFYYHPVFLIVYLDFPSEDVTQVTSLMVWTAQSSARIQSGGE